MKRASFTALAAVLIFPCLGTSAQEQPKKDEGTKTIERCTGPCEFTYYHFTEPVTKDEQQEPKGHPDQKKAVTDPHVKDAITNDAAGSTKKDREKLEWEETKKCTDPDGKPDPACVCQQPKKPPKFTPPPHGKTKDEWDRNPGEKSTGTEHSFPFTGKGGGGVDLTVTYKIVLKYDASIKVTCKCNKKP